MTLDEVGSILVEHAWQQATLPLSLRAALVDAALEHGQEVLAQDLRVGNRWLELVMSWPFPVLRPLEWSIRGQLAHAMLIHLGRGDL